MNKNNYSPAYGPAKGSEPPNCKECEKPLRALNYETKNNVSNAFSDPPWNSGWDGKCGNCGFDYNLNFTEVLRRSYNEKIEIESGRRIKINIASKGFPVFIDEAESLSGVEIEITSFGKYFKEQKEKIFISTNELKFILSALKSSPILEQFDWGEDWT